MTYALVITRSHERTALAGRRVLQAEAAAKGELYTVARLDDPSAARSVRPIGGAHDVTPDGPFVETKELLVGFHPFDCGGAR